MCSSDLQDLSTFDQWIIQKLGEVEKKVDEAMEDERFSDAANALYHFVWYQFCDWYIEFSKPVLNGTQADAKETMQIVMMQCLNRILRLLHPFCPFLTEEIYQKLPLKGEACIIDVYPTPTNDKEFLALGSQVAEYETDLLKEVITAVRNIRGENRISPAEKLNLRLAVDSAEGQKILSLMRPTILTLGRVGELTIEEEGGNLKMCAVTQVNVRETQVKVIIPLAGLVDVEEEVKRIHKLIEKLTKDVSLLSQKLSNEKFVANADEDVVQADRELLAANRSKLVSMQEALGRLQDV